MLDIVDMNTFVGKCPALDPKAVISNDFVGGKAVAYGIGFTPADELKSRRTINGKRTFRQGFQVYPLLETVSDADRVKNYREIFALYEWALEQADNENYPSIKDKYRVVNMTPENPMRVEYEGSTAIGLYQCMIYVEFEEV